MNKEGNKEETRQVSEQRSKEARKPADRNVEGKWKESKEGREE